MALELNFEHCSFTMDWMRVWYFGSYLDWYPRNRVIRKGLKNAGAEVIAANVPANKILRWPRLLLAAFRLLIQSQKPDVIIVPEVDLESFPAAWLMARILSALLVYDAFYSRWDALVNDEREVPAGSAKARMIHMLEGFTIRHADLVLADSTAHADYIAEIYKADRAKFETVYIGADDELFRPLPGQEGREEKEFLVHYNGFYHRLQGTTSIIEAAAILKDEPEIKFEMIGKRASSAFKEVMVQVEKYKLSNITFVDTLPLDLMPARMARARVCLGIFGKTGFGERVFPNKGFQTLAMGIPLITRESRGSKEVGISGEHFLAIPAGDGKALADAILFLKNNPDLRRAIGAKGKELFDRRFAPLLIGKSLLDRFALVLNEKGGI